MTTDYQEIRALVNGFDPRNYARSRNHVRGEVSRLAPYISRGVISTKMVRDNLLERSYDLSKVEKFVQELAWRDYWQQIWISKGDAINADLKSIQTRVDHHQIPAAIVDAHTGIEAIDKAIRELYETGYMHNHLRMYTAAIACNIGRSHWHIPAVWHYYHLLDGDWASNALSWQWVAGSNAGKKYIADQENINRYSDTNQSHTFMSDVYNRFPDMEVPAALRETRSLNLFTPLPFHASYTLNTNLATYLYNWYNLDPVWDKDVNANRLLLLEPSVFKNYPISQKSLAFMLDLAKNIEGIQIAVCEFEELASQYSDMTFHFKEHPLNAAHKGQVHERDWMSSVKGYYPSFFAFWKKAQAEIIKPKPSLSNLFST